MKRDPMNFLNLFADCDRSWVLREFERHARCGDRDVQRLLDGLAQSLGRVPTERAQLARGFVLACRPEAERLMRHCLKSRLKSRQ